MLQFTTWPFLWNGAVVSDIQTADIYIRVLVLQYVYNKIKLQYMQHIIMKGPTSQLRGRSTLHSLYYIQYSVSN